VSFHKKLRRIARKNNAVITSDPDGLMATLQVVKRLISESTNGVHLTIMEALDKAVPMAAPKDPVRAWWAALKVIFRNTTADKSTLQILSDAIAGQGRTNIYAAKGPKA
jgi:hypothetical protein